MTDRTHRAWAQPEAAEGPLPILWFCGPPGAGKSVIAWEVFGNHHGERVAYVDIDQLTMRAPESGDVFDLAAANLARLVDVHRSLGTRALIVSGVITPDQLPVLEAGVAGQAVVTWCLVTADDGTLRRRVRERGWSPHLVDMVIADADAWRSVDAVPRIDTTATTPGDAARTADDLLHLRPTAALQRPPRLEPLDGDDLVVVYGPRAVGKSTISWGLFMDCAGRGEPTGYLDADQLGFVHADAALRGQLICRSVASLAQTFADAGAVRTVVNGNLTPALVATLHESRARLVLLDAPRDVLIERIAARKGGDSARLAGDDLVGATSHTRAAVLQHALRQRDAYAESAPPARRIDVSSADPVDHVRSLADLLTHH